MVTTLRPAVPKQPPTAEVRRAGRVVGAVAGAECHRRRTLEMVVAGAATAAAAAVLVVVVVDRRRRFLRFLFEVLPDLGEGVRSSRRPDGKCKRRVFFVNDKSLKHIVYVCMSADMRACTKRV